MSPCIYASVSKVWPIFLTSVAFIWCQFLILHFSISCCSWHSGFLLKCTSFFSFFLTPQDFHTLPLFGSRQDFKIMTGILASFKSIFLASSLCWACFSLFREVCRRFRLILFISRATCLTELFLLANHKLIWCLHPRVLSNHLSYLEA